MALKPADMESCDPKRRCISGVNEGVAYTPGDECSGGLEQFSEVTCDCEAVDCCTPVAGSPGLPDPTLPSKWRIWGLTTDPYTVTSYGSVELTCGTNVNCASGITVGIARYVTNRSPFNDPSQWTVVGPASLGSVCATCLEPVTITYEGPGSHF